MNEIHRSTPVRSQTVDVPYLPDWLGAEPLYWFFCPCKKSYEKPLTLLRGQETVYKCVVLRSCHSMTGCHSLLYDPSVVPLWRSLCGLVPDLVSFPDIYSYGSVDALLVWAVLRLETPSPSDPDFFLWQKRRRLLTRCPGQSGFLSPTPNKRRITLRVIYWPLVNNVYY